MQILELLGLNCFTVSAILINLVVAVVILTSVRFVSGILSGVNSTDELAEKDNPAFGIAVAGVIIAVAIMLTGAVSGDSHQDLAYETLIVAGYGVLGLALMSLTRFVFDKVSMPSFSLNKEILDGNQAAGILDAGNVIATAIILRAVMVWVDSTSWDGFLALLGGYVISQVILSLASFYRIKLHNMHHKDSTIQNELLKKNSALAWRFVGYRIGVALAITAASGIVPFDGAKLTDIILLWTALSVIMMVLVSVLSILANKIVLSGIDEKDEVNNQKNVAVGLIQCVVSISMGLLLVALMV
ncbi:MAG: DUF350 domain-containing protein [Alphaproteobacteria bacterium]|nr:DUF350 domain-containing protein [Alphaproteobacteria bacterium]